jgi:threonine dehydrogenase-like Zn-dependent dehydrogenase
VKAIVYQAPNTVTITETPKPVPPEGWALIRVAYAGVCGSDMTIYSGRHPRAKAPLNHGARVFGLS